MFSYGWRASHGEIEPIFGKKYIFELAFQCHRFEVHQHHVAEVMSVLLKISTFASREEAVEEMRNFGGRHSLDVD